MAWADRFYSRAGRTVEQRVGEQVELIARATRPGVIGALVAADVARITETAGPDGTGWGAGALRGRMKAAGGGKGARLPESFLIALTPGALWVFTLRQGWTGLKVSKQLGALPRAGLRLWTADSKIVKRFALQATDGSAIAFEMNQGNFATTFATSLRAALPPSWSAFKDRRV